MILHRYEQYKHVPPLWTWVAILLLALLTLGWAMMTHMAVPDVPRQWDFGVLPDTPGGSDYSTLAPPAAAPVPPQVALAPNRTGGVPEIRNPKPRSAEIPNLKHQRGREIPNSKSQISNKF